MARGGLGAALAAAAWVGLAAGSGAGNGTAACAAAPALSWHIHVLFWPSSARSVASAMQLQREFDERFHLGGKPNCTFQAGDPQRGRRDMCSFEVDWGPAGPFLTAQFSWFVPRGQLEDPVEWIVRRRNGDGHTSLFIHPNSGCEVEDHANRGRWNGQEWPLDTTIFSCESPGCIPKG